MSLSFLILSFCLGSTANLMTLKAVSLAIENVSSNDRTDVQEFSVSRYYRQDPHDHTRRMKAVSLVMESVSSSNRNHVQNFSVSGHQKTHDHTIPIKAVSLAMENVSSGDRNHVKNFRFSGYYRQDPQDHTIPTQTNANFNEIGPTSSGLIDQTTTQVRRMKCDDKNPPKHTLYVNYTTEFSGYIHTWDYTVFSKQDFHPDFPKCRGSASATLQILEEHVLMVSFNSHYLRYVDDDFPCFRPYVQLLVTNNGSNVFGLNNCSSRYLSTAVYNHSITVVFMYKSLDGDFEMLFSFHPASQPPHKLASGKWNCSMPDYASFKQHVHCNLEPECHGGEDEGGHCPFSSPACDGGVPVNDKCYNLFHDEDSLYWHEARERCISRRGDLPAMRSEDEWRAFWKVFRFGKSVERIWVGLHLSDIDYSLYIYGNKWMWVDNTVPFTVTVDIEPYARKPTCWYYSREVFYNYYIRDPYGLHKAACLNRRLKKYICEFKLSPKLIYKRSRITILGLTDANRKTKTSSPLVPCPKGHMTYEFLRCDIESDCGVTGVRLSCGFSVTDTHSDRVALGKDSDVFQGTNSVAIFMCDNSRQNVPYTLVCDFRRDCSDGSDESFCVHSSSCREFTCKNKQCIKLDMLCDFNFDCIDESDETEEECLKREGYSMHVCRRFCIPRYTRVPPPAIIYINRSRDWTLHSLNSSQPCPDTHFRCPPSAEYCLPVYMRCNSINDCPFGEDEADCESFQCPGFYRCRGSPVCVHPDHLCDGLPQCPQRDDELHCDLPRCPEGCRCQGLSFVCDRPFLPEKFTTIRYLDASYSGILADRLKVNLYLVFLKVSSCGWNSVPHMDLPNLQHLDLSYNGIEEAQFDTFVPLKNLRVLRLSGNPLASLTSGQSASKHHNLNRVDLSQTKIKIFDTSVLSNFPSIEYINVSFSAVSTIADTGFSYTTLLTELDLRGNPVVTFPSDVYRGLTRLQKVYSDNYKLCCKVTLPDYFEEILCLAPQDELSSCEDLLRSDLYRSFLWIICVMSGSGNAATFLFRFFMQQRTPKSGFNVFVANLCVADFLMGVYLAMVGIADHEYRGKYLLFDVTWKKSIHCKTAGFLSLLSSEVSAFTICLITLDRFIVLRFPFTSVRFERLSAALACMVAWTVGIMLAAVPLLPVTTHWEFYSQSGICIPLPVTRRSFEGRDYAFGVMIVFNFTLFLLIAAGQAFIFRSVRTNSVTTIDSNQKSKDITIARRLISVAVSDFLCWFPIGLLGLLASAGVPVTGEVNVIMAIFVLPFNAALNPFLYTFNMVMERRRVEREKKLLLLLESSMATKREVLKSANGCN